MSLSISCLYNEYFLRKELATVLEIFLSSRFSAVIGGSYHLKLEKLTKKGIQDDKEYMRWICLKSTLQDKLYLDDGESFLKIVYRKKLFFDKLLLGN